ncbi:hypothetical protein [Nitrosomonas communis]|uniref:Uncharacterized protein n=1 Tax=Nitrosomonas communis TaxID=44574 RepID=A0A1H2R1C5_9PROT|nr:hypothetical protein [Nitrosomonas communis]SDW12479.1 hypothetical protein SAMN05421882_100381 [Nitrosomonas communis]
MSQRDCYYDREKKSCNPSSTGFAPNNALCIASASNLVYEEYDSMRAAELIKWEFDRFKTISASKKRFIDTQAFVRADSHILIITFCGTEPVYLEDWPTDAQFDLTVGPRKMLRIWYPAVFYEVLDAVWLQLEASITELRTHHKPVIKQSGSPATA